MGYTRRPMKGFALALAAVLAALPAEGSLLYTFSFTTISSPIQDFSFSLTSATFVGPGTPAFDPFKITDGANVWTMEQDSVGISTGIILGSTFLPAGDGCFSFGSAGASLVANGCASALQNSGASKAAFSVDFSGGLPAAIGTYSNLIGTAVIEPAFTEEGLYDCCGGANGNLQLTITQIPEPRSCLLLASGIGMIAWPLAFANYRRVRF